MKKKDLKDLKEKSNSELVKMLNQKRREVGEVYGKVKVGRENNLKKARNLRLEIVQIMGVLSNKESLASKDDKKEEKVKKGK
ncbi:MAG TPA: 50S ribosomal protein L29 [Patescibacteria group bacterium]